MVEFLVQTGLRISEALPLTKADLDFGRRRVLITRRLSQGTLDAPKSRHGIRQVSLSPELARRLWTRLATSPDHALVFEGLMGCRSTGRRCIGSCGGRGRGPGSSGRSASTRCGTRAGRCSTCGGPRRSRSGSRSGITRGSSRRRRTSTLGRTISRTARCSPTSPRRATRGQHDRQRQAETRLPRGRRFSRWGLRFPDRQRPDETLAGT